VVASPRRRSIYRGVLLKSSRLRDESVFARRAALLSFDVGGFRAANANNGLFTGETAYAAPTRIV